MLILKKIIIIVILILSAISVLLLVKKIADNKKREINLCETDSIVLYLKNNGWETDPEMIACKNVIIPYEFNNIYIQYNNIQKQQGFNLEKYKGSSVLLTICPVTNYHDDSKVYAELLIKENRLIGADLKCSGANGFIKPLNTH